MRRSTVLSLPFQLAFPGLSKKKFPETNTPAYRVSKKKIGSTCPTPALTIFFGFSRLFGFSGGLFFVRTSPM